MAKHLVGRWDKKEGRMRYYDKRDIDAMRADIRNNPVAPMLIQDTIDWMKHPGTGKYTDSRSTFDLWSKATGLVPADNKPIDFTKPTHQRELTEKELAEVEADIDQACRRAWNDLKWGQQKLTEDQKEYAAEVNKTLAERGADPTLKGSLE